MKTPSRSPAWWLAVFFATGIASCDRSTGPHCPSHGDGASVIEVARTDTAHAVDGRAALVVPAGAIPTACKEVLVLLDTAARLNVPAFTSTNVEVVPDAGVVTHAPVRKGFREPLTLILKYDPAKIPAGADVAQLRMGRAVQGVCTMWDPTFGTCSYVTADTVVVLAEAELRVDDHEMRVAVSDSLYQTYLIVVPKSSITGTSRAASTAFADLPPR